MSMDLNNDVQDAGVVPTVTKPTKESSEFYQLIGQDREAKGSILNYNSNSGKKIERPYTFDEVQKLSAPSLKEMLIDKVDGKTAEEQIQDEYNKSTIDGREQAILLEAMKFGSQSALYERSFKFKKILEDSKYELSRIFNFGPLLLAGGRVIPPIIVESDNMQMVEDPYTRRTVKKSYKIIEQARVVNTPIDWREYLIFDVSKPSVPSKMALPIRGNSREELIWSNGVAQGWEAGMKQANDIMLQSVRKLERDYIGMIRFHIMRLKNMVSSPVPSSLNLGVTGDKDSLNIGEVVFEVIDLPKFNKDAETWEALPQIKSPIDFEKVE